MIFKEDWWVVPLIIILGLLFLYHICTNPGNGDTSNTVNQPVPQGDHRRTEPLNKVGALRGDYT